jgi:membrane fusion protein (multidrug efflux system)
MCCGALPVALRLPFLKKKSMATSCLRLPFPLLTALLISSFLTACGQGSAQTGGGMPPPEVAVVTVQPGDVGIVTELPGRLEASRTAQVRARTPGIVLKRIFKEGSDVRAGQPLFQIDPSTVQAAVASAQATLARAQANHTQAAGLAQRYKPLVEANAISKQDYVNAVAAEKAAEADVAAAKAAVETARINLGYATVTAPISGRIGRALVTEGALVGQGEATPLANIQQINPMYANFNQSATEVLQLRRALAEGKLKRAPGQESAQVRIVLDDGSAYPQPGRLLFSDLSVDPTSGQILLRAEVPNPNAFLLPGMYVRVRLEQAQVGNAILLPQQAVTRSSQGDTVMTVDKDGKVAPRPVKVGNQQGNSWVILSGLNRGDQVIVEGFQKIRPGAPVKATPWQPPGTAPAAAPAASAASGAKK